MTPIAPTLDCPCALAYCATAFVYEAPPAGETRFPLAGAYRRDYVRCGLCGHWFGRHAMDMSALYRGAYVSATYRDGLKAAYDRIMALPPERSDNAGRVRRILDFVADRFAGLGRAPRLLDVGAGLAVFPARMREAGWDCTALDPDPAAGAHAEQVAGVRALAADFRDLDPATVGRFEAITFNKVLEHVETPVALLAKARTLLSPRGLAYVELPDGDAAAAEGPGREEFFIEHHHVFAPASVALLAARAGFSLLALERLREPSSKFTLRAFLAPAADAAP